MVVNGSDVESANIQHIPVLVQEVVELLGCRPGGRYVDCTLGQGGLTLRLLEATGPDGQLIGIDRDASAIAMAGQRLKQFADRIILIHGNFLNLKQHLESVGMPAVHGIVFDLGLSSAQVDEPERGFSFMVDGPLDMRMDRSQGSTAADLLNQLSERELSDLIFHYGEERYARRIARAIVQARTLQPLRTTFDLVYVIRGAVPRSYCHARIHCGTRTFQALRIAVNQELEVLERAFRDAAEMLAPGGRLCIISFHSLEDRIAKHTLRDLSEGPEAALALVTKKPLVPSDAERHLNPRARSAKLRVAERRPIRRCA